MVDPVVSLKWVQSQGGRVVLADVRWYLDGRSGRAAYDKGHLPGAVFVDLDRWLAGPASAAEGRHPLPAPEVFAQGMTEAGIGDEDLVIAYDDAGGVVAARLVWMLRATGHDAALLDGGLTAYVGELQRTEPHDRPGGSSAETSEPNAETGEPAAKTSGPDAETGEQAAETSRQSAGTGGAGTESGQGGHVVGAGVSSRTGKGFSARPWPQARLADVGDAAGGSFVVLDARDAARFRGEVEPVDPQAGHIPGARSLPCRDNVHSNGCFLPVDELRRRFTVAGVTDGADVISYCGSGVTACHNLIALEHAGFAPGRLYPGSWSQYSADPANKVATGS